MGDEIQKVGMLEENPGEVSYTRSMCLVSFLIAIAISSLDILGFDKGGNAMEYYIIFMIGAFAPKVIQKFAEKK